MRQPGLAQEVPGLKIGGDQGSVVEGCSLVLQFVQFLLVKPLRAAVTSNPVFCQPWLSPVWLFLCSLRSNYLAKGGFFKSGGLGSARLMVGFDDVKGLFSALNDSMILWFFTPFFFLNNAVARLHLTPIDLCSNASLCIRPMQFLFQRCSCVHQYKYVRYVHSPIPPFCLFPICAFHACAMSFLLQDKGKAFVLHKEI